MPNIYHFKDLSKPMQEQLLQYIVSHFSKRRAYNKDVSAYGLKQHFTGLVKSKDEHVTSQCFSEAMEACGYKARLCGSLVFRNYHLLVHRIAMRIACFAKKNTISHRMMSIDIAISFSVVWVDSQSTSLLKYLAIVPPYPPPHKKK